MDLHYFSTLRAYSPEAPRPTSGSACATIYSSLPLDSASLTYEPALVHDAVSQRIPLSVEEALQAEPFSLNAPGGLYGNSPLHAAVLLQNLEAVKTLLRWGADLNAEDEFNYVPLKYAADGREEIDLQDGRHIDIDNLPQEVLEILGADKEDHDKQEEGHEVEEEEGLFDAPEA